MKNFVSNEYRALRYIKHFYNHKQHKVLSIEMLK